MKILLTTDPGSTLPALVTAALGALPVVLTAVHDADALARHLAAAPDAIVVDASVTWTDPVALVRETRTAAPQVHLAAITRSTDDDLDALLLQAGARYCVPVNELFRLADALRWLEPEPHGAEVDLTFLPEPRDNQLAFCVFRLQEAGVAASLTCLTATTGVESLFGVPAQGALGKRIGDAFPALSRTVIPQLLVDVIFSGQSRELGELRPAGEGPAQVYQLKAFPLPDRCAGLLCENVTSQRVAEETQMRTEEHLLQTRKMEAIGRLAAGVAHDFNNLMTAIVGYADLLMADMTTDNPMRQDIEEIQKATERATDLTRKLSALSPHQVVAAREVDLNDLIRGMEARLRGQVGADVQVQLFLQAGPVAVMVDPGRMEQVLTSLAVNAREAMPGGGKLTIETSQVTLNDPHHALTLDLAAGDYVLLTVTDNGIGMDGETRSRAFEPFFTTKANAQGLGLTTVYGIVRQMHGAVEVQSERNRGTIVKIFVPGFKARSEEEGNGAVRSGEKVILLAEDEEILSELMGRILRRQGFTVLTARNGNEALKLSQEHPGPIHLLITDVVMPHLGGPELATAIHAQRPETRILFISGYTDSKLLKRGVKLDTVDFMQKPFTPEVFHNKVVDILTRQPQPFPA